MHRHASLAQHFSKWCGITILQETFRCSSKQRYPDQVKAPSMSQHGEYAGGGSPKGGMLVVVSRNMNGHIF